MIKLKEINYTDASSIDVGAIIENFNTIAVEIEAYRLKKNVIPTGLGSFSCPIMLAGTYDVIPSGHPRLDVISAYAMLGDNIKQSVKASLLVNEKKIAGIKFTESERSGKIQIFDLPDDIDLGTDYSLKVRTSDDRRLIVNVMAGSLEAKHG